MITKSKNQNSNIQTFIGTPILQVYIRKIWKKHIIKTVCWHKNIFMVPTGAASKKFVNEISRLLNQWINDMPLKNIVLKAIYVTPAPLLQKQSKVSKAKYHLNALERRLRLWEGNITELVNESKTIQERLPSTKSQMNMSKFSSKFKQLMQKVM